MRPRIALLACFLVSIGRAAAAQTTFCAPWPTDCGSQAPLTRADSTLIFRILSAEDRRDSTDAAFASAAAHRDGRVQLIARRALARIRDARFASRDSFPTAPPLVTWPEPSWRLRYRALTTQQRDSCGPRIAEALADSAWPVRLRALDLVTDRCAPNESIARTVTEWIDAMPKGISTRRSGEVSWQAGAHALVALARMRPADAQTRLATLARHPQWEVRMYAARAAGVLADTTRLRQMAMDANANVQEAAIDALSKLVGHGADDIYITALGARDPQAVRAAAIALKGSSRANVKTVASRVFERWVKRANASERDARVALLEAAGRPATDDKPPATAVTLPASVVSLALGSDVRLRVTMTRASGGGTWVVRLRGDVAPIMAARVLDLAYRNYYDGGNWHRVEPDFVIQGGGPGTNEYVGYYRFLRDELGTVPHARGTIGMSTRSHDTGDAQWFVNLRDNIRLGRDYTVFAEVIEGMEVVDGILEGDRIESVRVITPSTATLSSETAIRQARAAFNAAIAKHDSATIYSFYLPSYHIVSGRSTQAHGADSAAASLMRNLRASPKDFYIRTPREVKVNEAWGLAHETGSWIGSLHRADGVTDVRGVYSAKWQRDTNGRWRLQSETFTTLECRGGVSVCLPPDPVH